MVFCLLVSLDRCSLNSAKLLDHSQKSGMERQTADGYHITNNRGGKVVCVPDTNGPEDGGWSHRATYSTQGSKLRTPASDLDKRFQKDNIRVGCNVRRAGRVKVDKRASSFALKPSTQVLRDNIDTTNDSAYSKGIVKSRFREQSSD